MIIKITKPKIFLAIILISFIILAACHYRPEQVLPQNTVHIAIPYEAMLSTINEEYYKSWLEAETGLNIEFSFISQTYTDEYLQILFMGDYHQIDAVFFSDNTAPTINALQLYGQNGHIMPLNNWLAANDTYLEQAFDNYQKYDLQAALSDSRGDIYYFPALDDSLLASPSQTMWINIAWLENLGLQIPTTTAEFKQVLTAFSENYPQSIPLLGSEQSLPNSAISFLLNSFTICDPYNYYWAQEDNQVFWAPSSDGWRQGLIYLHDLYQEGLFIQQNLNFTERQLIAICNDPRDLVGSFVAQSVSDIISEQSPQLISRFMAVQPLASPSSDGVALAYTQLPLPGGIVLNNSDQQEQLFKLMDLMCSDEAFLIGHYGQKGLDWEDAKIGDISINGNPAVISITNLDFLQHHSEIAAIGPFITNSEYADHVAWKGYQVNQSEYLDARAARLYENYLVPQQLPRLDILMPENADIYEQLYDYANSWLIDFIDGTQDIEDDEVWQIYLDNMQQLNIDRLGTEIEHVLTIN